MEEILNNLNLSQRQAVEYTDGPQLIIAGAGSGKTRVLTYKIAYLLNNGYKPWNLLALTFTNKAAREMKERIAKLVGQEKAAYLRMGTFHSIFAMILRKEAQNIGFQSNFTIYDDSDSKQLVKSIVKELSLDDKLYKPSTVHARISRAKNNLILADDYSRSQELMLRDKRDNLSQIYKIYDLYVQRCRLSNVMDFDDLLIYTYKLFVERPDVKEKYANTYSYVLVDEYQDTNYVQQCILLQLTKEHQRICVVGDDAQSIYGFRGANIDNILEFEKTYPACKLFKLEQNYRSTQFIVKAANSLIKNNLRQIPKNVFSQEGDGEKLKVIGSYSDREEAAIITKEIRKLSSNLNFSFSDCAILYRTNAQSRVLEDELRKYSIPYRIYGGMSFYQRKEIKDIVAYFRVIINPYDDEALKRIFNFPTRGIGNTTIDKIISISREHNIALWTLISELNQYDTKISKAALNRVMKFASMISEFISIVSKENAYDAAQIIMKKSGLTNEYFRSNDSESIVKQENITEFLSSIQEFVVDREEEGNNENIYIADYLQEISLLIDNDKEGEDSEEKVSLMTVHASKGLEFPIVFITGLEENLFPSSRSIDSPKSLEEERRLLYVAITRAERKCYLTYSKNRFKFGHMEQSLPSRFLSEIDKEFVISQNSFDGKLFSNMGKPKYRQKDDSTFKSNYNNLEIKSNINVLPSNFKKLDTLEVKREIIEAKNNEFSSIQPGTIIEHPRFGIGKVLELQGAGENTKAKVEFNNIGIKQLLLKFARFKIIKGC